MVTGLVIMGNGMLSAVALLPTLIWNGAVPGMLKRMASLVPKAPPEFTMSGLAGLLPVLMAMMASRSDTVPSAGSISSIVVVTVIIAGANRGSNISKRSGSRRGCRGTRRERDGRSRAKNRSMEHLGRITRSFDRDPGHVTETPPTCRPVTRGYDGRRPR